MPKSDLILFTANYPFGNDSEAPFLNTELEYLSLRFNRIFLVPAFVSEGRNINTGNFILDASLADILSKSRSRNDLIRSAINSPVFWKELFLIINEKKFSIARVKAMLWIFDDAVRTAKWLDNFITRNNINVNESVFYTYWLWKTTLGVGLAKKKYPDIKLISRAHGFDLYEYRNPLSYFPYRFETLKRLNKLYLISEHGMKYIVERYPEFSLRCKVSRLGVRKADRLSPSSTDGILRIVSCAYVKEIKRLDLMVDSIDKLAKAHPSKKFVWVHFGGGPLLEKVKGLATNLPSNVEYVFRGNVANGEILKYYWENPIDLFLSVSSSEGVPMSIMEAQSYGIPVIATSVGGVPEIVSFQNGFLLNADPSPDEVSDAIWGMVSSSASITKKRHNARETWARYYDADVNFLEFANNISETS